MPVERVISPELQDAIDRQAYDLCESTNATTDLEISEAYRRVKQQIATGLIAQGEGLPLLTKRIAEIFTRAEGWRARRIAQTEAARAFHQALEATAKETGAVEGWRWLAAGDACPTCGRIAREVGVVKLGHAFAVTSDNPVYGRIPHPPAHPGCNCTMEAVLVPELRAPGDNPSYGSPLDLRPGQEPIAPPKEEPEGTAKPEPEPSPPPKPPPKPVEPEDDEDDWLDLTDPGEIEPPKPKPIAPPPTPPAPIEPPPPREAAPARPVVTAPEPPPPPKPGARAILPGAPIQERIAAYTEGDAKVAALQEVHAKRAARLEAAERERVLARDEFLALSKQLIGAKPKDIARLKPLAEAAESRLLAAKRAYNAIHDDPAFKDEVMAVLKAKSPLQVRMAPNTHSDMDVLSTEARHRQKEAEDWLSSILDRADSDGLPRIEIGQFKPGGKTRAYCDLARVQVAIAEKDDPSIIIHELGHALDDLLYSGEKAAGRIAVEFLEYRVGDEAPRKLKDMFPDGVYDASEDGRKDNFEAAFGADAAWYVGKPYGSKLISEITSMGLQELYMDAAAFAANDPEYCKFILGYLDGSLR